MFGEDRAGGRGFQSVGFNILGASRLTYTTLGFLIVVIV